MPIKRSELEDAYGVLRALGYDEAVFAFDYAPQNGARNAADTRVPADVLVANTENHKQKLYPAGNGPWPAGFGADLRAGVFGPPPKGVPVNFTDTQK